MDRTVETGKTLLVDGPASAALTSGKAVVFGFRPGASKVVIREGKRLPFLIEEKATFDLSLAENAGVEEVDGSTIPSSWPGCIEQLSNIQTRPVIAIVLGAVDSGKSSFCTYLANELTKQKKKVAILDGDLGQSDIGPPCTVAYAFVTKPITDLFNLRAKNAVFIGATSPQGVAKEVIEGLTFLRNQLLEEDPDVIIVNSDGWVEDEDAARYKVSLVEAISPGIVICIKQKEEMARLLAMLEKSHPVVVESPSVIAQRSKEKRKNLRELGYTKYLRNAKVQSLPLGWLKIEDDEFFGLNRTQRNMREASKIYALLGMKPLHFTEYADRISVVIGQRRWIDPENLKKLEETTKKKAVITRKGEEEGLLIAFYNAERKFLGIGVLKEIDYLRRSIKILTPVSENIAITSLGRVKLDKNMKELSAFAEDDQATPTGSSGTI